MAIIAYEKLSGKIVQIFRVSGGMEMDCLVGVPDAHPSMRQVNRWSVKDGVLTEKTQCVMTSPNPVVANAESMIQIDPFPDIAPLVIQDDVPLPLDIRVDGVYFTAPSVGMILVQMPENPGFYADELMIVVGESSG